MTSPLAFRAATEHDCTDLALLADMATRRLTSFFWGEMAASGQSPFEVGRNIIRNDETHFTHFRNWRVATLDGSVVGALNGYVIPAPTAPTEPISEILKGISDLKNTAAGTWYIAAAAVLSEYQGKGFGKALLAEAETVARAAQRDHLTLALGSLNLRAHNLYRQAGFEEWGRRPFAPFPGSDASGEWILMGKDVG